MKVLVVDDCEADAQLSIVLFERMGFDVDSAIGWEDCEAHLKNNSYDLIVLDYFLGKDTALTMMPKIRELSNTCIIVMSGMMEEGIIRKCIKAGAEDFVDKDIWAETERLKSIIEKSLRAHEIWNKARAA